MDEWCVVCNFSNPYRPGPEIGETRIFHRFPKNIEQRQRWLEAIGMKEVSSRRTVCSSHFSIDDYKTSEVTGEKTILLNDTALPRFNLNPAERSDQSYNNAIESENIRNIGSETEIQTPEAAINQQVLPTNPGQPQLFQYLYFPGQPLFNFMLLSPNAPVENNEQITNLNEQNMEAIKKGPTTIDLAEDNEDNDKGKETAINQQVLSTNPGQPQPLNFVMLLTPNVPVKNNVQIANLNEQNMETIKKGSTTIDLAEDDEDNDKGKETDNSGNLKEQRIEINETTKSDLTEDNGKEIEPIRCLRREKITQHDFTSEMGWKKYQLQKRELQKKCHRRNYNILRLKRTISKLKKELKLLKSEKKSVTQESSSSE